MGYPDADQPKRIGNNNQVFDPTPPESIGDTCVFCGQGISDAILKKPETVCNDCHRPTCPDCIKDLRETGLWGCWQCSTVDIDERNPQIQKELEKIREKKLRERTQPIERHRVNPEVSISSNSLPTLEDFGSGTPYSSASHAMAGIRDQDQYPYRDPPNPLDREEGWGVAPLDIDSEDVKPGDLLIPSQKDFSKVKKWKDRQEDLVGVIGSKMMINKVRGEPKDLRRITRLIMTGEDIDNKAFGKDETYGQIYTRIDWNAADTIAGYTLNEDARSYVVAEIMKELQTYYTEDLFKLGVISKNEVREALRNTDQVKEEAQRGTGRTTQRIASIFGHFLDGSNGLRKNAGERRLLYLVNDIKNAGRVKELMVREYNQRFYKQFKSGTLQFISERIDVMSVGTAISSNLAGKHYTLIIADITYDTMVQYGEKINKMMQYMGAPVIGDILTSEEWK